MLYLPAAERVELVDVAVEGGSRCHLIERELFPLERQKWARFATGW